MTARLVIIGCGKSKLDRPAPARDLYTGSLFRAARRYAEESGHRWFIASALYALIPPDRVESPYDVTIAEHARDPELAANWVRAVARIIDHARRVDGVPGYVVELHMGEAYASRARAACLVARSVDHVEEPLRGLTIGRRLQWYANRSVTS